MLATPQVNANEITHTQEDLQHHYPSQTTRGRYFMLLFGFISISKGRAKTVTASSRRSTGVWRYNCSHLNHWNYTWHGVHRSPPLQMLHQAAPWPTEPCSRRKVNCSFASNHLLYQVQAGFCHVKTSQTSHRSTFTGVPSTQIHFPSSSLSVIPTHAAAAKPERNFWPHKRGKNWN